ncbi:beta-galactosidase [Kineosporia sp. J2-2]|uniref:Beta-galactosidase n=1 Tax=Kineosporia corallincola TaxID=2835133 RepID=A0ABS5TRD3_9ACTN|nr:beta-galactosidase [Kineosporia corallincola]MBT0773343.1 beta-galactosidase [Kineosporia corallincola]
MNRPSPEPAVRRLTVPPVPAPESAPLDLGGAGIAVTRRHLTRSGEPWIPVMGEYHYSRDRPGNWERELRKMRAGGVGVVSAYVVWILHEEVRGRVRWDGHLDLRRFVRTAGEVGLDVVVRIGPWVHGETRNGGFPDWLQELPVHHRTDDPAYLAPVRDWYAAIGEQLEGLFLSDEGGGPVIGVQIENELYDQPGHLGTLRTMAEAAGLRAPLWTATGWGGARLPRGRVLPVYAGYPDGFWEESATGWPDFGPMHFSFSTRRDDLSVGADLRTAPGVEDVVEDAAGEEDPWPFATCELGGGMQVAYHRRPLVDPDDVAALALTKIGSGSAWQGYYLYHGATQVPGELAGTQESQATGYPNDLPVLDYDFFAPIGAAGAQRPHFHRLRRQHLFLQAFGAELATAPAVLPEPDGVRWSVRANGSRGFLFVNNHQPAAEPLPAVDGVRFEIGLGERNVTVPREPVGLRPGAYFTWPVRQAVGEIPALTATAQPVTQLLSDDGSLVVLAAVPGIPVELQIEGVAPDDISGADLEVAGDLVIARPLRDPGPDCVVRAGRTTLVFLDEAAADALWKGQVAGRETLLIWPGSAWFDGGFRVVLPSGDQVVRACPPLALPQEPAQEPAGPVFSRHRVPGASVSHPLQAPRFGQVLTAPVRTGGSAGRLSAPTDGDFAALDPVALPLPGEPLDENLGQDGQLVLRVTWTGDALRLYAGQRMIADQFWSGRDLEVDLTAHRDEIRSGGLWIRAFAWAPGSGVHVDPRVRPHATGPVLTVHAARLDVVRTRSLS